MMGFLDNVKMELGSKKEDVESQNGDGSSVNDEILDEPSPEKVRNFKYLDNLIRSGLREIVLDSDIVLGSDEESQYLNGIKLDVDDLAIDGNGHIIDAQGLTRIFYCTGNVIIKNIILKNGFAEDGGAIYNTVRGSLSIMGFTLENNTARYGGAISNWGELRMYDSILSGNTAQSDGGAIHNWKGELTIIDSTITGNTAQMNGGAIHNEGHGKITITESTLNNNTAQELGGAIHNKEGELTLTESTITWNTAQELGGAIYNDGSELTLTESTITWNTVQEGDGGVIHNNEGNFKIFNCEFSNNKSPNNIISNKDSLQIHNAILRDNQSKYIVLNDGEGANLGIFNGEFSENNVEESVLCNTGKFCSIEKTVFENNISNNMMNIINESELTLTSPKIKDEGKSILNQNYILLRKSPIELENIIYGGGSVDVDEKIIPQGESFDFGYLDEKIHENKTKEIILDYDITFENYERDFYEGGIELDMDDLIINGNGHTIDGVDKSRIFIITGKNITLKNIIFKNGHSLKNYDNPINNNGGAIRINYDCNITIENCEFINNTSKEGGAIHNRKGELTISESTLTENTAESGGAIHNRKGELTISESTLTENTAQGEINRGGGGGAIYNDGGELTITESTLTGNTARKGNGGAINNDGGELTIMDSILTGNTAQEGDGGAINNRKGELTIMDSILTGNTAQEGDGGAINNRKAELTITESTLIGNTAHGNGISNGGGAISNLVGKLTITDSTLIGNTAQGEISYGGAISNWGELTITDSTLTGNTAGSGGAVYNWKGELTITDSTLTGNTAGSGGAIFFKDSKVGLKKYESENCTFKDNDPDDVYEES